MYKYFLPPALLALIFVLFSCKTKEDAVIPFNPAAIEYYSPSKEKKDVNKALFVDAKKAEITGDIVKAETLYKKVLEDNPNNDAAYFELAEIYYRQNNLEDAKTYAREAVNIDPDNKWYKLLLAELYQKTKQFKEAAGVYESLLQNNPGNLDYRYQLSAAYIFSGNYNDALKQYDLIEEQIGITEEISEQKKKIYLHLGKTDKAAEELKKLVQAFPDESRYYSVLAEFYISNNEPEKALEMYQEISEKFPEDPYIHISLADYYRKNNENEKAFSELKKGFENPALNIDTKIQVLLSYYTITEIYEDLRGEAMELAEIMVKTHPDDPKSYSMYADFLVRDERYEEARTAFYKVLELDNSKYLVWEGLLRVEAELGDFPALAKASSEAIELFPAQPAVYLFNGVALFQLEKYEQCIDVFERGTRFIVDNNPLLSQFYMYIGDAHNQLGNHKLSDEAYDKVLSIDPGNSYVLNNYAYYLSLRNENLEKAETMARKASELDPANSANLDTYGWVLYKLGRYNEAKEWLEKALDKGGNSNAVILEHYGDVLYKLGNKEEAVLYWEKADKTGSGSEFLKDKVKDGILYEE